MKLILLFLLMGLLASCAAPKTHYTKHIASAETISKDAILHLDQLASNSFEFHGEQNLPNSDDKGYGMAYPGGLGIAGFLAGIATHSIVEGQLQNSKAAKEQELADQILAPISGSIKSVDAQAILIQAAQGQQISIVTDQSQQAQNSGVLRLNVLPVFYVSADYTELRIQSIISIYESVDGKNKVRYQNLIDVVRIVPATLSLKNMATNNPAFTELVSYLLTEAMSLGVADATNSFNEQEELKTFKIIQSKKVSYERAKLVSKDCSAFVIRTLRNWIKSVPMVLSKEENLSQGCDLSLTETPSPHHPDFRT